MLTVLPRLSLLDTFGLSQDLESQNAITIFPVKLATVSVSIFGNLPLCIVLRRDATKQHPFIVVEISTSDVSPFWWVKSQ
jgi:hypothetical protein